MTRHGQQIIDFSDLNTYGEVLQTPVSSDGIERMSTFGPAGRWYIAALILLTGLLLWDVQSRIQVSNKQVTQQFETSFQRDASRREGIRELLLRDLQSSLQLSLHSLSPLADAGTDEARAVILNEAFAQMRISLRNSRYSFFNTFLVQETPDGDLILRGRYPRDIPITGIPVANTPLFNHVDLAAVKLFEKTNAVYQVEDDSLLSLLSILDQQTVFVSTRLIFDGDIGRSRWFVVFSVGLGDLNRSIDTIGEQMAGGTTPMRMITVDARTNECLFAWDAGVGDADCTTVDLENNSNYRSSYDNYTTDALTYSFYQPNDAYRALTMPTTMPASDWRASIPLLLALLLLFTTAAYMRYRATSANTLRSLADSLRIKDSVNTSIHDVLSLQLENMSQIAFAMRGSDIPEPERRYFDIAISEFMQAKLNLNTLRLESPPTSSSKTSIAEQIDVKQLMSLGQMMLEVSTIDTPVDIKFLQSDDLPRTVVGQVFSVQTAMVAAINLSAETTDEGRIEVSFWVEERGGFDCLNLRIIDSGVGWGLALDQQRSDDMGSDSSVARKALLACLNHSGTELMLEEEGDDQNEYQLRL